MKIRIKNGRVIDPASQFDARQDLYISHGKIVAIGEQPEGFEADKFADILGLKELGLTPSVIAPIGYRSEEDETQHYKKVRKSTEELFINI